MRNHMTGYARLVPPLLALVLLAVGLSPTSAVGEDKASWLFVMTGEVETASNTKLAIRPDPTVVAFSDRPERLVRAITVDMLIDKVWDAGKDSFVKDPPNAAVVTDGKKIAIEELKSVARSGDTVVFLTKTLAGPPPAAGKRVAVVIDQE